MNRIYREVQEALGIPWVPQSLLSLDAQPDLLTLLWSRLQPVVASQTFLDHSMVLLREGFRELSRWVTQPWTPPNSSRDRQHIARTLDALIYGNAQLLLLQTVLNGLLRDEAVGMALEGDLATVPREGMSPFREPAFRQVNEANAPEPVRALLKDIRQVLGVEELPMDFSVLAQWPEFLALLWAQVKAAKRTDDYFELCGRLTWLAEDGAATLTPAASLDTREVRVALGDNDEAYAQLVRQVEIHTAMAPGLLVNDLLGRVTLIARDSRGETLDTSTLWQR